MGLFLLIGLEGLLAADNAIVLAIMVKHLPEKERRRALGKLIFYGVLLGIAAAGWFLTKKPDEEQVLENHDI